MGYEKNITQFDIWNVLQMIKVILNDQSDQFFGDGDPDPAMLLHYYPEAEYRHCAAEVLLNNLIHDIEIANGFTLEALNKKKGDENNGRIDR